MTETDWLACDDPTAMLNWVSRHLSLRKKRLYAVASCRRVWDLLRDDRCRQAIEAAEAWADRSVSWREVTLKRQAADAYYGEIYLRREAEWPQQATLVWASRLSAARTSKEVNSSAWFILNVLAPDNTRPVRDRRQCALLGDLVGPLPFRKVHIDPAWLAWIDHGTVRRLAEQAYAERRLPEGTLDPTLLGVLADALVDASCEDTALLSHLRDPPHWRGCFAVDLLLGKS